MTTPADTPLDAGRKPPDDEIEVFGLTNQGKVRKDKPPTRRRSAAAAAAGS